MVLFVSLLILIVSGMIALHVYTRLRYLQAMALSAAPLPAEGRYKPMLRLLSPNDVELIAANKSLSQKFRKQRLVILREYLACLTKDYGRLLAGLRSSMVASSVDRPDLAAALSRNQMLFVIAVCRIEYRIWLYRLGIGTVDVSGLVFAIDALRSQVAVLAPAMQPAR